MVFIRLLKMVVRKNVSTPQTLLNENRCHCVHCVQIGTLMGEIFHVWRVGSFFQSTFFCYLVLLFTQIS